VYTKLAKYPMYMGAYSPTTDLQCIGYFNVRTPFTQQLEHLLLAASQRAGTRRDRQDAISPGGHVARLAAGSTMHRNQDVGIRNPLGDAACPDADEQLSAQTTRIRRDHNQPRRSPSLSQP
jgi:hypothetical protein